MKTTYSQMDLTGCGSCGVVMNAAYLEFPDEEDIYLKDGSVDFTKGEWCSGQEKFVPFIPCPVCDNLILKFVKD